MLIDAHQLDPGRELEADVAVIGAGACGITLARRLAGAGHDVLLLEGGGTEYEDEVQSLYRGVAEGTSFEPGDPYLVTSRLRYLGGTTNHWAGWCRPLDPHDLERRDWLEHSGWPIGYDELAARFAEADRILELPPPGAADARFGEWSLFERSPEIDRCIFRFSPPVRFRVKYGRELTGSERIRLLLYANVQGIRLHPDGGRVAHLEVASSPGRRFRVRARLVVAAGGGVENARLLLLSDDVQRQGIGNAAGLVGRFFMDHPHRRLGRVLLWEPPRDLEDYRSPKHPSQRTLPVLRLTEELRRRSRLLGATVQILRRGQADAGDPAVRALTGLDRLRGAERPPGRNPIEALLNVRSEQSPNPESRVTLDEEVDPFGLRRVRLDWRLRDGDLRAVTEIGRILAAELARTGIGRLHSLIDDEEPWAGNVGGDHHIGTTRMAATPAAGVVDPDCRVFGVDDLYVAGSSVFPTCGYANPTYTIVALTLRLADHLEERLRHA